MNNRPTPRGVRRTRKALGLVAACAIAGCHMMVDPFTDELASRPPVSTASVDAARAAETVTRSAPRRAVAVDFVRSKDAPVTHGPLYFDSRFERPDPADNVFAWAQSDYLSWVYETARFMVCTVFYPVSATLKPPWTLMASDGHHLHPVKVGRLDEPAAKVR